MTLRPVGELWDVSLEGWQCGVNPRKENANVESAVHFVNLRRVCAVTSVPDNRKLRQSSTCMQSAGHSHMQVRRIRLTRPCTAPRQRSA